MNIKCKLTKVFQASDISTLSIKFWSITAEAVSEYADVLPFKSATNGTIGDVIVEVSDEVLATLYSDENNYGLKSMYIVAEILDDGSTFTLAIQPEDVVSGSGYLPAGNEYENTLTAGSINGVPFEDQSLHRANEMEIMENL